MLFGGLGRSKWVQGGFSDEYEGGGGERGCVSICAFDDANVSCFIY